MKIRIILTHFGREKNDVSPWNGFSTKKDMFSFLQRCPIIFAVNFVNLKEVFWLKLDQTSHIDT
jgi:hypothetical protein